MAWKLRRRGKGQAYVFSDYRTQGADPEEAGAGDFVGEEAFAGEHGFAYALGFVIFVHACFSGFVLALTHGLTAKLN